MFPEANKNSLIPEIQSTHAILTYCNKYILQLRDNKPNIAAPGQWSLFGGLLQKPETPLQTIKREIYEELVIEPLDFSYLWFMDYIADYENCIIRSWFFCSNVDDVWPNHQLMEGQAAGFFVYTDLKDLKMPIVMRKTLERFNNDYLSYRSAKNQ